MCVCTVVSERRLETVVIADATPECEVPRSSEVAMQVLHDNRSLDDAFHVVVEVGHPDGSIDWFATVIKPGPTRPGRMSSRKTVPFDLLPLKLAPSDDSATAQLTTTWTYSATDKVAAHGTEFLTVTVR